MTLVGPLVVVLLAAPSARQVPLAKAEGSRLEQGTRSFNAGDFEAALKALDAVALEGSDPATLERVHLLRAQCHAARQDFVRAEEAFALALDANPETSLDPAKVDPTIVKLLESVRARLTGTLVVASNPVGATLVLDGKPVGAAPQTLQVQVGKHRLEAYWSEGARTGTDLQVRPRREVRVEWVQGAEREVAMKTPGPEGRKVSPYGDFRFAPEISATPMAPVTLPLELGGGFEFSYFRAGLAVRLYPVLGLTPRFAFSLPVMDQLNVTLEIGVPFHFYSSPAIGFSGNAGVELYPVPWFGAFALVGARHYFLPRGNDATAFTATAGVRLRVP
jgi:hypothetical protein